MLGKGNTAEIFEYDQGRVCKLFFEGYPQQYIEHEYQNAKEVFGLKLKTPEPFGQFVKDTFSVTAFSRKNANA